MNIRLNCIKENFTHLIYIKKTKTPFCPLKVDDKLIRSRSVSSINDLNKLKKYGVTQIIDLRNPSTELSEIIPQILERIFCKLLKIDYNNFKYSHKLENIPSDDFFEKINNKIINNEGITCIHCRHGKRRTSVCVGVYEKEHTNKSKKEILDEVYNLGFKELHKNAKKVPSRVYNRLINIYNNFISKYYPEEAKL